jgi:Fur family zinc uptake transcriptional regulator
LRDQSEDAMPVNDGPSENAFAGDHDHRRCVADALEAAEGVCKARGVRLTPIRRRVLELVWESHRPAGAYAILDAFKPDHPAAAPATVYRALDFLLDQGLVHRIQSLNAFVGCDDPAHPHRGFFLICTECGDAAEVEDAGIERAMERSVGRLGFAINSRTLEARGVCRRCRAA